VWRCAWNFSKKPDLHNFLQDMSKTKTFIVKIHKNAGEFFISSTTKGENLLLKNEKNTDIMTLAY